MTLRLHLQAIQVLEVLADLPERVEVAVAAIRGWVRCHRCGEKTRRVHQTKKVKIRDLAISGRPTTLVWHRRRFRCCCGATTTETHPAFEGKLTVRLARQVVADVAVMTVAAAARRHGLSWWKTMQLVAEWGARLIEHRRRLRVRVLLIDEKAIRKGHNSFSTILTCGETGTVIAVLDGRSGDVVAGWLARQSPRWRRGIEVVVTDMALCYRAGIRATEPNESGRKLLPRAIHVADRFHVVRNFMSFLVALRRAEQATPPGEPHDPDVFRARYLLLKRWDRLSADENVRLGAILAKHPDLYGGWELTQRFHTIFEADDLAAALRRLADFVDAYEASGLNASTQIRTFLAWSAEIFNYHRCGGWTTNVAEGTNNKIETLERMACGFYQHTNYRHRVILFCPGHPHNPTVKTPA
jgi:transposase